MNNKLKEVFRFIITGGVSFLVEFIALVFFRDTIGFATLIATPLAFLISVFVNYILCVRWVFIGAKEQKATAKAGFLITSLIGLILNEFLMWLFGMLFGEDDVILKIFSFVITMYMINKVLATLIVMIWNYFTKRFILNNK